MCINVLVAIHRWSDWICMDSRKGHYTAGKTMKTRFMKSKDILTWKPFYQSQVKLWSVTHSFTRVQNNIKLMRIWLMQILDNRLSRYFCWCCWGKCCWLFMRRCCVTKKEVASLWKMMCDVRADCVTQRELVWLNDTSFRSLSALGNVCSKSTIGDFDSDQSIHFFRTRVRSLAMLVTHWLTAV